LKIRKKCFSEEEIKCIAKDVASGISYLHSISIIHRDIKPENILMDYSGCCKISDFGISSSGTKRRSTIIGSLGYISPEIIFSTSYNEKIDIWSFGISIIEIAQGKNPLLEGKGVARSFIDIAKLPSPTLDKKNSQN